IGGAAATGPASIRNSGPGTQQITAGTGVQSGGIQVFGGGADAATSKIEATANAQTVSTTGTLTLNGGSQGNAAPASGGAQALLTSNGTSVAQTITAAGIVLQGGTGGSSNFGEIRAAGPQTVTVGSGGISVNGGSGS